MRLALAAVSILGLVAVAWTMTQRWRQEELSARAERPAVPVTVEKTRAADVPIILRGLGTVTAFNTVNIQSRVPGNIVKINFTEGQRVTKGETLVEIDPRPYQAAYDQASATLARDRANLTTATNDLARYAKLQEKNYVSKMQYTDQVSLVASNRATVEIDVAALEAAKLNLDYCFVTSPIDGVTGLRQVDLGNLVQANSQTLVVVTQIEPIYVVFTLPGVDTDEVRQAMLRGQLATLAYDQTDRREIARGALNLLDNEISPTTGMVKLKAQFANVDGSLWPGQFVNAHLVLETVRSGVVAPSVAIQTGPEGSFVYVVGQDDVVEARPVVVRQTEQETSLIASGLAIGEQVVTSGYSRLVPGMRVTIASSPASASHAATFSAQKSER